MLSDDQQGRRGTGWSPTSSRGGPTPVTAGVAVLGAADGAADAEVDLPGVAAGADGTGLSVVGGSAVVTVDATAKGIISRARPPGGASSGGPRHRFCPPTEEPPDKGNQSRGDGRQQV